MPIPSGPQWKGFAGDLSSPGDPHNKEASWIDNRKDFRTLMGAFSSQASRKKSKRTDRAGMDGDSSGGSSGGAAGAGS